MNKTIALALNDAYKKLIHIESPRLDARLLLQAACNLTHEQIIAYPDKIIYSEIFDCYVNRRAANEPVSHILGKREFYGYEFKVTKDTLDPRPDSETLIEAALEIFPNNDTPLNILDLGTGTGCLLLTLLKLFPRATGLGIDISEAALEIARFNCQKLNLSARFIHNNWLENLAEKFDLIISNPPYIKISDEQNLAAQVKDYEPHLALFGGDDGLSCYLEIAKNLSFVLKPNARVILEFGIGQENEIAKILRQYELEILGYRKDLAGITRCLIAR
jgi:release factor glutamine methyltransferase